MHTVFEPTVHQPAGTNPNSVANPVDHSAIQWWQIDPALEPGAFTTAPLQRSVIEDLTADNCHNGAGGLRTPCTPTGTFYAFPSIAVNNTEDALIGYSRFNALDWAAAAYSYREHTDPVNTFRDPVIYKVTTTAEGSGRYSKSGNGELRWGDYSIAQTDPRNDHHFRVADITTFPQAAGEAQLRALSASDVSVSNPCGGGTLNIIGTTLEQAASPNDQPNGGGWNSSLTVGTITLGTGLLPGASVDVSFRLGVMVSGSYRYWTTVEALP